MLNIKIIKFIILRKKYQYNNLTGGTPIKISFDPFFINVIFKSEYFYSLGSTSNNSHNFVFNIIF